MPTITYKDEDTRDHLLHTIQNICKQIELSNEVNLLKEELGKKYEFGNVIQGNSPAIRLVFGMMEKAAGSELQFPSVEKRALEKNLLQ
ncbi:MAG: sigma-54-dependent Fis family transcriptional regulator, partial [Saprospiraceae bacterium]|nr:sigma-54-dependent Fis family transcriptional regulator [Candidatus Brachybacter algidus]